MSATIHIVDDDEAFRTATGRLLRAMGYAVESYESGEQLLQRLSDNGSPSCLLLDVRIPGLSGPELQDRLSLLGSTPPIVFLTGHADIPTTVRVIKAGADDLLTKPVTKDELVGAIERALERGRALRERSSQLDTVKKLVDSLTPRERQVFDRVARGRMNKEIARELGTTERTIKAHRHNVMEKVQVTSVAELVLIAERLGILAGEARETTRSQPV